VKVRFEFTTDDPVDVAERTAGRSRMARSWRWQDIALSAIIGSVIAYLLRSGPPDTRLKWAVAAAMAAAVMYSLELALQYRKTSAKGQP
jgi:hypothetical protein